MYDIAELERQWKRYRQKRLMKYGAIALVILILVSVPLIYASYKSGSQTNPAIASGAREESNGSGVPKKTDMTGQGTESMLKTQVPSLAKETARAKGQRRKTGMKIILSDHGAGVSEAMQTPQEKKIRLEMITAKNTQVIKEIEARFPTTRDYDDAMYLAKYYYGKKNYRKAEYWALQANTIDSGKEESWLIFGKAKAKQGRRVDALRILQSYYDRSGSTRVKDLIDRIRKGRPY